MNTTTILNIMNTKFIMYVTIILIVLLIILYRNKLNLNKFELYTNSLPQVDNTLNTAFNAPQFKSTEPSYAYDFQPGTEPPKASQLNYVKQNNNVLPYPQVSNNYSPENAVVNGQYPMNTGEQKSLDCFPKDIVTPQELMPKEDPYNTWNLSNPPVNGHLADKNFLESGYHFGIDTQSSSLKNANLQLRSDPVIPQIPVGPWMQSTISADTNRRQFEVGGDY